jgi:hypothetical protein
MTREKEITHRTHNWLSDESTDGFWANSLELVLELLGETGNVFLDGLAFLQATIGVARGNTTDVLRENGVEQGFPGLEVTGSEGGDSASVP